MPLLLKHFQSILKKEFWIINETRGIRNLEKFKRELNHIVKIEFYKLSNYNNCQLAVNWSQENSYNKDREKNRKTSLPTWWPVQIPFWPRPRPACLYCLHISVSRPFWRQIWMDCTFSFQFVSNLHLNDEQDTGVVLGLTNPLLRQSNNFSPPVHIWNIWIDWYVKASWSEGHLIDIANNFLL